MENTFEIICTYMGEEIEITLDSLTCTESDVLEQLQDNIETEDEKAETFEVSDWGDVPEWAQDWDVLEELMPAYANSSYDLDVFKAAHDLDIQFSDVDEAYSGKFDSDEDFAQDMAEQTGSIDKNLNWPYTCIDWEQAARELMYDYSESDGHYFRNF